MQVFRELVFGGLFVLVLLAILVLCGLLAESLRLREQNALAMEELVSCLGDIMVLMRNLQQQSRSGMRALKKSVDGRSDSGPST